MIHTVDFKEPFCLELGGELRDFRIVYHTYGTLNADKSNVAWVCHALTGSSDVPSWWPHTVEAGAFLDPEKWFVICANIIGSPYGTTCPLSVNPSSGSPYYADFPPYTIRDIARAHALLADYLGIRRINMLVGSSVGGFQALEWIAEEPERFDKLILIATDAMASPWTIAIDETQRMAITTDPSWGEAGPHAASGGLAAARAIALLTYRGAGGYNATQQDPRWDPLPDVHRASTYQRYQGEKLVKRFDAYSYMAILNAFDTHNIGRGRGGIDAALAKIRARTIVIGITTDIIFTPGEMQSLASKIPGAEYKEISSEFGHDGFLVEHDQLNSILNGFINESNTNF